MISTFLTCLLLASAPVFDVQTLDGRTLAGTVSALNDKEFSLDTTEGLISLKLDHLQELAAQTPTPPLPAASIRVYLIDGSVLAAEEYAATRQRAKVMLRGGLTMTLPARAIRAVQFRPENAETADWAKILGSRTESDLLVVRADEHQDTYSGVLHDVTEELVRFDRDGEELPVKRGKIYGLIYHHPAEESLPAPRGFLFDAGGSKWAVHTLSLADELLGTTPAGLSFTQPLENVVRLDLSLGKILFLSDLESESTAWTPFFSGEKILPAWQQFFAPRKDKNFDADPLRIAGKTYRKGLALHSRTEIVFRLPAGFKRLKAVAGIDDAARPQGNVHLVIRGDEKVLCEETLRGADPPQSLDLDVSGVRRLTILADFGENLGIGDDLDLGEARLIQ